MSRLQFEALVHTEICTVENKEIIILGKFDVIDRCISCYCKRSLEDGTDFDKLCKECKEKDVEELKELIDVITKENK